MNDPHFALGAVNLLMSDPPYATEADLDLAQLWAEAATAALPHRHRLSQRDEIVQQLQTALDSRLAIEQAKGVLSTRLGVSL
ncbi:ANTAR domain-containing protein [Streptomyces sp. Ru73]|uniref:ANTAR domain-containing protein n=1 Tax=Streptomyces sp. Ru73 TaxID=2080748 RepID=UPI0011B05853|nr:ANTAR domain-containing protein [Streptomyces sp. Ru73]